MKTIKIFLASSEELKQERLELADLVEHLNNTLERRDITIRLVKWEYLDASMGPQHKQEEYNDKLRECEMCMVLYWTKFGMYTKTELDTAYKALCEGRNPHKHYIYFKEGADITPELKSFRDEFPKQYGHFYCSFQNIDTLKADFLLQFLEYQSQHLGGDKVVEVRNSQVIIDGKTYVDLKNVPFAGNNEEYNNVLKLIKKNRKLMAVTEPDDPDYAEYAAEVQELLKKQQAMEDSLWDTALTITRLSTTHCSERLERAMDLFTRGDNKGAQAVLNEAEIERDVQHNLNLIKLGEEGRKGLKINIDEYKLKIRTLKNEMSEGWGDQVCELYKKVEALTKKIYGEQSLEVADTLLEASDTCHLLRKDQELLANSLRALEIYKVFQDEPDAKTAVALGYVGKAYLYLAEYSKSMEYNLNALKICEKVRGTEHPDIATSYNNIGLVYSNQGDYPKALEYYEKSLSIREKVLGTEHSSTAASYNNIGLVYGFMCNYPKALDFHLKALEIAENVSGSEHPDTAASYNNIGNVYSNMGDYPKSLEYHLKALEIRKKVLGAEHPDTAASYNNIVNVYERIDDHLKALEYKLKAMEIREKVLGTEHPRTASSYNNVGNEYRYMEDYPKALKYHLKAMEIREKVLGTEHPDTAASYHNLGVDFSCMGNYPKALKYHFKALEIREKVLGTEHPSTACSYNGVAWTYLKMGKYEEALPYIEKAKASTPENPDIIDTLTTVYQGLDNYQEVLKQFELCMRLKKENGASAEDIQETEE